MPETVVQPASVPAIAAVVDACPKWSARHCHDCQRELGPHLKARGLVHCWGCNSPVALCVECADQWGIQ